MMSNTSGITAATLICVLVLAMANSLVLAQDSPRDFLKAHNRARREVNVPDVQWDDELERRAQRHAARCDFKEERGRYGENIFWDGISRRRGGAPHADDAVALWVAEKDYYHCRSNTCSRGHICDHYTQVVWRETTRIGCAVEVCRDRRRGPPIYYYVCKYDPIGNVRGKKPYRCPY